MTHAGLAVIVETWLRQIAEVEHPAPSVIAFNVGLFETPDGYGAHLIGADRFDDEDGDWACEATFEPEHAYLLLPRALFARPSWEPVLAGMATAVAVFLASPRGRASFFQSAQAVTVGFEDGDLVRII